MILYKGTNKIVNLSRFAYFGINKSDGLFSNSIVGIFVRKTACHF